VRDLLTALGTARMERDEARALSAQWLAIAERDGARLAAAEAVVEAARVVALDASDAKSTLRLLDALAAYDSAKGGGDD
jgi:hypothetical protein